MVFWAAVRFLGKKTIDYFFDKTLAKFNIQFSKLHQDRAEVIRELMKRLIDLREAMRINTYNIEEYWEIGDADKDGNPTGKKRIFPPKVKDDSAPKKLVEAFVNARDYLYQHQISFLR